MFFNRKRNNYRAAYRSGAHDKRRAKHRSAAHGAKFIVADAQTAVKPKNRAKVPIIILISVLCALAIAGGVYLAYLFLGQQTTLPSVTTLAPQPPQTIEPLGATPMIYYEPLSLTDMTNTDQGAIALSVASAFDILEVRVVDAEGALVEGVDFTFTLTDPDGESEQYDIEGTGSFEVTELEKEGRYIVTLHPDANYPTLAPQVIDLKPNAVIEPLTEEDLKDKIKDESEIEVSKEDAEMNPTPQPDTTPAAPEPAPEPVPEAPQNTIEPVYEEKTVYKVAPSYVNGFTHEGVEYIFVVDENGIITGLNKLPAGTLQPLSSFGLAGALQLLTDGTTSLTTDSSQTTPATDSTPSSESTPPTDSTPSSDSSTSSSTPPPSSSSPESTTSSSSAPSSSSSAPSSSSTTPPDSSSTVVPESSSTPTPAVEPVQIFDGAGVIFPQFLPYVVAEVVKTEVGQKYIGWHTIDGQQFYFDENGNKVTGYVTIGGVNYYFNANGALDSTVDGIDVSKWQPNVDWNAVKNSGIDYVIIRAGYRGYSTGALVEDPYYRSHINGAIAAGLDVGVYFFTQAITVQEAVEEASFALQLTQGYNLKYGITFDTEYQSGGRANNISASLRTQITNAFCDTVRAGGKTPMVYASKSWFLSNLDYHAISHNRIWLAHYTDQTDFPYRYDMWQYTSQGSVPGVPGNCDKNYSYLGI